MELINKSHWYKNQVPIIENVNTELYLIKNISFLRGEYITL